MKKYIINPYMMTLLYLFIFILTSPLPVTAHVSYMPGTPEVEELVFLYAEAGLVFPAASFPLAKRDLVLFAEQLKLQDSRFAEDVNQFLRHLKYEPESVTINAALEVNYENYFRSSDAEWINPDLDHDSLDFYRHWLTVPDFLKLALYAGNDDAGGIYISAGIKRRYSRGDFLDSNFLELHTSRIVRMENYNIRRGYLYHYFGNLEMVLGRNSVHLGAPDFSTFMASERLPYLDGLTLRYRLGPIYMTSIISTLENRQARGELDLTDHPNWPDTWPDCPGDCGCNNNGECVWPDDWPEKSALGFGKSTILYSVHRFDYTWNRLRFGIAAQHFAARENNAFHLGDIFPVFSWHNADVGPHNMSLILDASFAPFSGGHLFLQAAYNDINVKELLGVPDAPIPTIDAYLAGFSYRGLVGPGRLRAAAEIGYTHFLWGNFYDYNEDKGNYFARGVYRYRSHRIDMMPMTSPYGPGTVWGRMNAEYSGINLGPGKVSIGFDLELLSRKDRKLVNLVDTVYDPFENEGIEGIENYSIYEDASSEFIWRAAARIGYHHSRFGSYFLEPAFNGREGNTWVELTVGGSINFYLSGTP